MSKKPSYLKCENCGMYYKEEDIKQIIEEGSDAGYNPNADLFCIKCVEEKSILIRVSDKISYSDSSQVFNLRDGMNNRELKNKITGQLEYTTKI